MNEVRDRECDVLIIGAGLAGGCLARHLRLEQPDLKIIVVDKKTEFDWWVGESTLELWDDYAVRKLRLGAYLAANHLQKHGLRFFFDSAEKDLPVHELSEIGWARYPATKQAWQIDRAVFDRDLCEINRRSGVEVLLGVSVGDGKASAAKSAIQLDREQGHVVQTSAGTIRCRWLVDAGGRSSPLAAKLDLDDAEGELPTSSYWARYEGARVLDDLGPDEWRKRVGYTQRYLSTCHFMYRGYWIWHIPLSEKILSLGVTFDRNVTPLTFKNGDDLTAFLRTHRALRDILGEEAELRDFMGLKHNARRVKQFFSADRWFFTGMSAGFVDPLLSFQSAMLTTANNFIVELIKTERSGDRARYENRLRHFNLILHGIYRQFHTKFIEKRNWSLGSFDAFLPWLTAGYYNYVNVPLRDQATDMRQTLEIVDSHQGLAECDCVFEKMFGHDAQTDRYREDLAAFLDARGKYYERNRNCFFELYPVEKITAGLLGPRDLAKERAYSGEVLEAGWRYCVQRMARIEGFAFDDEAFTKTYEPFPWSSQKLATLVDAVRAAGTAPHDRRGARVAWTLKGRATAEELRVNPWIYVFTGPSGESLTEELWT